MLPDEKIGCHRLQRKCYDGVVHEKCQLWVNCRGRDPQTGVEFDRWGCSDSFMLMAMIENSQMQRQTGAAVESFRNEVVKANEETGLVRQQAITHLYGSLQRMIPR